MGQFSENYSFLGHWNGKENRIHRVLFLLGWVGLEFDDDVDSRV